MAKSSKAKKAASDAALGTGKLTPVMVAFLVERFLVDNDYTKTLAAFRSEASDIFSKTKGKEVPQGLLPLGYILEEYISLKEQRMVVDQEKRRVEVAFQGLQDVMRAYNAPQSPPLLWPPASQIGMMTPSGVGSNPSNGSPPQGHLVHKSFVNCAQPIMMLPAPEESNKFATPLPNCSSGEKRKALGSAPKAPPAPKKCRAGTTKLSRIVKDNLLSGKVSGNANVQVNLVGTSAFESTCGRSNPVQGSSIAKNLFNNPPEVRLSSSPKTPPRALHPPNDKDVSPAEIPSLNAGGVSSSQKIVPSSCAIISSETIIISPCKQEGYYAVERSYHVSASPLKSSPEMMNKREHVKGRLDFDESSVAQSSEEAVAFESSSSTNDGESAGSFDFDLPDLEFFDGDFTKLLGDIDLECEHAQSCQQYSGPADFFSGLEQNAVDRCLEMNQTLSNPCLSTVTEIVSQERRGPDTMTSMRSITKRIMIASPSKNSCHRAMEPTESPTKL